MTLHKISRGKWMYMYSNKGEVSAFLDTLNKESQVIESKPEIW